MITHNESVIISNGVRYFKEEQGGIARIQKYMYNVHGTETPVWVDLDNKHPDPSKLLIWGWDENGDHVQGDFKNRFTPTKEKHEIPWSVNERHSTRGKEIKAKADAIKKFIVGMSEGHEEPVSKEVDVDGEKYVHESVDLSEEQKSKLERAVEIAKKGIQWWNVFEYHDEQISVEDFLKFVESGDEESIVNYDNIFETAHEGAFDKLDSALESEGVDEQELLDYKDSTDYDEALEEVRLAIEDKANYNWDKIFPSPLFVRDRENEIEMPDMYSVNEPEGEEPIRDFRNIGHEAGFSDEDIKEVISNSTYGGMGGVGVIDEQPEDLRNGEASGTPILYIVDNENGSGHYVIGKGNKTFTFDPKEIKKYVDHGSYSLGDVFGTRDWVYK
jgi:hypothetical protein